MSEVILDFLKRHGIFTVVLDGDILQAISTTYKREVSLKDVEGYTVDECIAHLLQAIHHEILSETIQSKKTKQID